MSDTQGLRSSPVISKADCTWAVTPDGLKVYDGPDHFKTMPLEQFPMLIAKLAQAMCIAGRPTLVISTRTDDPTDNRQG